MATVFDVAAHILEQTGELSAMKLQKLVYYSQAWHLVWDDEPLFAENIEAWANGPVCTVLYAFHRLQFSVPSIPEDKGLSDNLSESEKDSIDSILHSYGDKSAQWLSDQTHIESPWKGAREGLSETDRGNEVITHASMAEFYTSLQA